ncbi:hypothetical protein HIO71_03845 [Chryseobacterium aquaticum]|uniref:Uncharacterized protein n=1 Tax=Chryseobacterium aquaticum TaxID=452084 RepID=A0A848MZ31_9FLAO|nr:MULTISPECIES: hypothetical protein [Chryseobacterium]NMR33336.1 hypothetical protein [Chryseobacterium aquaticum]NRQ44732.1 hypothetical protein [Chryseobacterium sp. C-204]
MEENKPTSREELKSYFEAGDYPTQGQFGKLIDSLRHKEDVLTNKEALILANSLVDIENGYIQYNVWDVADQKFSFVINQQDEEDQLIEIGETKGITVKKYFYGNAPYTIKAKKFPSEGLKEHEYYVLQYQIDPNYYAYKLFGNNLPTTEGFEFGTLKGKMFYCQVYKNNIGQRVNILNTRINFKNNTDIEILYRTEAGYWSDKYKSEDSVTDHYDVWDYLTFHYNANLQGVERSIECRVYNTDNEQLLQTGYLYSGQNNENTWGGQVSGVRNIRIECNYTSLSPQNHDGSLPPEE